MKKISYIINIIFIVLIVAIAFYELLGMIINSSATPFIGIFYMINLLFSLVIIISFCVYKKYKKVELNYIFLTLCLVKFLLIIMILNPNLIR